MLKNNFLFSILAFLLVAFAFFSTRVTSKEGFLGNGPSFTVKVQKEAVVTDGVQKGNFFSVPQFQASIAPRMFGGSYGSNITYNLPSYSNLAVPQNPEGYANDFKNMAREGYASKEGYGCGGGSCSSPVPSCGKGGTGFGAFGEDPHPSRVPPGFAAGDYNKVQESGYSNFQDQASMSTLPLSTMTTVDASGNTNNVQVWDRLMYSNRTSRLRKSGDKIRGDLPIVPCNTGWFRPSVAPNIDLEPGALNVMAGNSEQGNALSEFLAVSSSGVSTTWGGVNVANDLSTSLGQNLSTVQLTSYP
jgi:hypothetical protein